MTHTRESIIQLLLNNDKAVGRALLVVYGNQTDSEKISQSVHVENGKGFTPADARRGVSMAEWYMRKGWLSPKQIAYWRKPNAKGIPKIGKYTKQLMAAIPS
jgi:hypothetical protein